MGTTLGTQPSTNDPEPRLDFLLPRPKLESSNYRMELRS